MTRFGKGFAKLATTIAKWTGRPFTFAVCCGVVIVWGLAGPVFGFSDTWQLVINTSTTIITFLMVFLIQNTQNRDSEALHCKLDELIRVSEGHNSFIGIENLSDEELEAILRDFDKVALPLAVEARVELKERGRAEKHPAKQPKPTMRVKTRPPRPPVKTKAG